MEHSEKAYLDILQLGAKPEQSRGVLPIDLATSIVCTANLREWRHIFRLRTAKAAHPQMRQIMCPLLAEARGLFPCMFDDVGVTDDDARQAREIKAAGKVVVEAIKNSTQEGQVRR
jgi:thymidylate synthase (FAD)